MPLERPKLEALLAVELHAGLVTLPFVLLLVDRWPLARTEKFWPLVREGAVLSTQVSGSRYFFRELTGTAEPIGTGSKIDSKSFLNVGVQGTGALTVENGGTVLATQGRFGTLAGGNATVTVARKIKNQARSMRRCSIVLEGYRG